MRRHSLEFGRRDLLRRATGLAAPAALLCGLAASGAWRPGQEGNPFTLGVASGDPWPDGVVLWTRLAPEPLEIGGGMAQVPVELDWELARDERFTRLARRGSALALPEHGHAVHVEVGGLQPGRFYWYRFRLGRVTSPIGRTRTAPSPAAMPGRLRFASAGCQHWEDGHFTAWRHLAEEPDLDLVFHYGDYIYESADRGSGPRRHVGGATVSLDDYRRRYAQYHADPDLAAAHAAHPFVSSFDDHEVENDWAGAQSVEDGRSPRHPVAVPPEQFLPRRAAAFQAWWENMPVRRAQLPQGPDVVMYRRLRFGALAEFHILDTRQYRDDQPCGGRPIRPCAEVTRPRAEMLGEAQERWLLNGLAHSGARWQVLAQQVMMMRREPPSGALSMDAWDGYPAARSRLLAGIRDRGISNVVVLSGDVHNAWAGDLHLDPLDERSPAVTSEFVASSITSSGDGSEELPETAEILRRNPHIAFFNNRRGYTVHEATPVHLATAFRAVPYVSRPGAPRENRGHFVVEAGRSGVMPA